MTVAALLTLGSLPAVSQNSPDPKSSDGLGNGPPAYTNARDNKAGTSEEQKRAAAERPVSGFVTDAEGKPAAGAVVQLKNTKTLQVRSYITHEKGEYFFTGLSKDVDYELKASMSGHASTPHTLSSFDSRTQPVINLQLK